MRLLYVIGLLTLALLVVAEIRKAFAHEFYDQWCCNETDCAPYHGRVEVTPQGFFVPEFNTTVPFKEARYGVPGDDASEYHLCEFPKGTLRCFYVRPGGM